MDGLLTIAGVALAPLAWYCLLMGLTPGPNNLMLAASGMNFGWRRTLPHIGGVFCGFSALVFAAGLGIGSLYARLPELQATLRWAGAAALVYLAWRIASASRAEHPEDARPLRFVEALLFQFANPKGWVFAITAATSFLSGGGLAATAVLTGAAMCVTLISTTTWTLFGTALARLIESERARRVINLGFALGLLATVPLILAT
ncbi:MAG: LysE family translocator [Gammaproteobacteria bacterium]|nr:LysE family translocator [Gammaproteobacteria bacterium]